MANLKLSLATDVGRKRQGNEDAVVIRVVDVRAWAAGEVLVHRPIADLVSYGMLRRGLRELRNCEDRGHASQQEQAFGEAAGGASRCFVGIDHVIVHQESVDPKREKSSKSRLPACSSLLAQLSIGKVAI